MERSMRPFITVVIPVRNEARFIGATLRQLVQQDYPRDRFEIIVADGMSTDGTQGIVRSVTRTHPMVRLVENRKRLSSAGRNLGFAGGRGDIFVVVDGHCHIGSDQYFNALVDGFARSGADCLGRPQPLDPPGLTFFQKAVAIARDSRLGHGGGSLIYSDYEGYASPVSNGAAYTREVIERLQSVDEGFDACEDVEFNYRVERAGFTTYTSPAWAVKYYPRESLGGLYRQMKRYGRGRYRFLSKHREAFSFAGLVPGGFVLSLWLLAAAALLAPLSPFFLGLFDILSFVFLMYGLAIGGESARCAAREGLRYFPLLPFIFAAIHIGLGAGFIGEMAQQESRGIIAAARRRLAVKAGGATVKN